MTDSYCKYYTWLFFVFFSRIRPIRLNSIHFEYLYLLKIQIVVDFRLELLGTHWIRKKTIYLLPDRVFSRLIISPPFSVGQLFEIPFVKCDCSQLSPMAVIKE